MTRAALPKRHGLSQASCLLATIVAVAFASQARADTEQPDLR